jgi:hypothetical protein
VYGETSVCGLKENMAADLILGINAYHADAAACIVRDGKLLAAASQALGRIPITGDQLLLAGSQD